MQREVYVTCASQFYSLIMSNHARVGDGSITASSCARLTSLSLQIKKVDVTMLKTPCLFEIGT